MKIFGRNISRVLSDPIGPKTFATLKKKSIIDIQFALNQENSLCGGVRVS